MLPHVEYKNPNPCFINVWHTFNDANLPKCNKYSLKNGAVVETHSYQLTPWHNTYSIILMYYIILPVYKKQLFYFFWVKPPL